MGGDWMGKPKFSEVLNILLGLNKFSIFYHPSPFLDLIRSLLSFAFLLSSLFSCFKSCKNYNLFHKYYVGGKL
jgi:hypothetical protein